MSWAHVCPAAGVDTRVDVQGTPGGPPGARRRADCVPESDSQRGAIGDGCVWHWSFHIGWNVSWARRVIYGLHGPTLRPDVNDVNGALFQSGWSTAHPVTLQTRLCEKRWCLSPQQVPRPRCSQSQVGRSRVVRTWCTLFPDLLAVRPSQEDPRSHGRRLEMRFPPARSSTPPAKGSFMRDPVLRRLSLEHL